MATAEHIDDADGGQSKERHLCVHASRWNAVRCGASLKGPGVGFGERRALAVPNYVVPAIEIVTPAFRIHGES